MAIAPPSDIILDVLRAADPTQAGAAAQRLGAMAGASATSGEDFAASLDRAARARADQAPAIEGAENARARLTDAETLTKTKAARASVDFEALLLNNLVGAMLPKQSGSFFGEGMAGDMWKSMLSEQVSRQIAKSGTLGISKRLFATHPMASTGKLHSAAPTVGTDATAQMSAAALSMPFGADPARGTSLFTSAKKS